MWHGSLFSGIGGIDLGFERAGIETAWQCEYDPQAREVLTRHWPNIERYEDVRTIDPAALPAVDIISGGFPCQDVSVAGKRAGLAGERSGLWFEFHRILAGAHPDWVCIENVPGLLSSNGGRDFAVILSGLAELGYRVAWRILDAQYFGVPQRRRRVFIIGHRRDGRAAEVLFEPACLCGHPAPRREAGEEPAKAVRASTEGRGTDDPDRVTYVQSFQARVADNGRGAPSPTVRALTSALGGGGQTDRRPLIFAQNQRGEVVQRETAGALSSGGGIPGQGYPAITDTAIPRRLTPTECARLQGFPDDWNGWHSDAARYRQLGNAVAVPVAEWIGRRIVEVSA